MSRDNKKETVQHLTVKNEVNEDKRRAQNSWLQIDTLLKPETVENSRYAHKDGSNGDNWFIPKTCIYPPPAREKAGKEAKSHAHLSLYSQKSFHGWIEGDLPADAKVYWEVVYAMSGVAMTTEKMMVVTPFFHTFSHRFKAMAAGFHLEVVFSNDCRLSRLTPFEGKRSNCRKNITIP